MTLKTEKKFWQIVGSAILLLGLCIMSGAVWMLANGDDLLDKTPSRIQAFGVAVALCGVAALVLARVLGLFIRTDKEPSLIWSLVAYGSPIAGLAMGVVQAIVWMNAVRSGAQLEGFTPWQKCVLLVVGFLVMTGVIALIGERSARLYVRTKALRGEGTAAGR